MKFKVILALLSALILPTCSAFASQAFDDVVSLVKNGASTDVIRAYIDKSDQAFDLSADDIVYLNDMGLSSDLIESMIDKQGGTAVSYTDENMPSENEVVETAAATVPDNQPDLSYFYEALSPYGTWTQDADYGWVWTPAVVRTDRTWRPYLNSGHWVWTDQGWFWQSDYSWGWAPFHYGRWSYRNGWVWIPDHVWSPAWVDWRYNRDYVGWAPLPPDARFDPGFGFSYRDRRLGFNANFDFGLGANYFAFVPASTFVDVDLRRHLIPHDRVRDIYVNTRAENNYSISGNRIVNAGVPIDNINRATRREIRAARIADAQVRSGDRVPGTYQSGNEIMVYRPNVGSTASLAPSAAIKRAQEQAQRVRTREARQANRENALETRRREQVAEQFRRREARQNQQQINRTNAQNARSENAARRDAAAEAAQQRRATESETRSQAREQQQLNRQETEVRQQQQAQQRQQQEIQRQQQNEQLRQQRVQEQAARQQAQQQEQLQRQQQNEQLRQQRVQEQPTRQQAQQQEQLQRQQQTQQLRQEREQERQTRQQAQQQEQLQRQQQNEQLRQQRTAEQQQQQQQRQEARVERQAAQERTQDVQRQPAAQPPQTPRQDMQQQREERQQRIQQR
jgi:hypothetical protein